MRHSFQIKINKEIKINNEEKYKKIEDILFIRELTQERLEQSISEEKYDCILCSIKIKDEKPNLSYKCQRIFHEKCLKDWDTNFKTKNNNILLCPNCKEELPLERWNKKLDYEINIKDIENLMNKMNEYKLKINNQSELLKKYEKNLKSTCIIFEKIIFEISSIHKVLKLDDTEQLNNLKQNTPFNLKNLNLDFISSIILSELAGIRLNAYQSYFKKIDNNLIDNAEQLPPFPLNPHINLLFSFRQQDKVIQITENELVSDAINKFKNLIKYPEEENLKFLFNGQHIPQNFTIEEAGLKNGSKILVKDVSFI